jgi:SPP1 family predicted phage head-tail adaptor
MDIGGLNKFMTLQKRVMRAGGESAEWQDVKQIWANVETVSAQAQGEKATHKIVARYDEDIKAGSCLVWGGKRLYVLRVANVGEENREMAIIAAEEDA